MAELDAGLVALMTTAVGTSVFSTGFLSARTHANVREAKRRHREVIDRTNGAALDPSESAHLHSLVDDRMARSVLIANVVLVVVTAAAAAVAVGIDGSETENVFTAVGFVSVELIVVALAWLDSQRASSTVDALTAPADEA